MLKNRVAILAATVVAATASAAYASSSSSLILGPISHAQQASFKGYYDGHQDTYLITDVSSKHQATTMHINYSQMLATVKGAPAQYFVLGRAAHGQLAVFGSEPGEKDYNPLWEEFFVTWKPAAKPLLLISDNQIKALAKRGKLTLRDAHIVLNAPIISVGK